MAGIESIEKVLSFQRRTIEKEISRLQRELEKIDSMMRLAKADTPSKDAVKTSALEQAGYTGLPGMADTRSLTEKTREQVRLTLPALGAKGYAVGEFADALALNGIHISNKMLSTILWRMAQAGEVEKIGSRRQTRWRMPQQNKAPDAGTSDASVQR